MPLKNIEAQDAPQSSEINISPGNSTMSLALRTTMLFCLLGFGFVVHVLFHFVVVVVGDLTV